MRVIGRKRLPTHLIRPMVPSRWLIRAPELSGRGPFPRVRVDRNCGGRTGGSRAMFTVFRAAIRVASIHDMFLYTVRGRCSDQVVLASDSMPGALAVAEPSRRERAKALWIRRVIAALRWLKGCRGGRRYVALAQRQASQSLAPPSPDQNESHLPQQESGKPGPG